MHRSNLMHSSVQLGSLHTAASSADVALEMPGLATLPDSVQTVSKTVRRWVKRPLAPFLHQWKSETAILSEGVLAFFDHSSGQIRLAVHVAMIQGITVPKIVGARQLRHPGRHGSTPGEVKVTYFCNGSGTLQEVLFQSNAADSWRELLLQSMSAENHTGPHRAYIPMQSLEKWYCELIVGDCFSAMLQEGRMSAFIERHQAMLKGQAHQ
eukprot:5551247-Amphidinium_carterae.1